jgi:hypothetical protein
MVAINKWIQIPLPFRQELKVHTISTYLTIAIHRMQPSNQRMHPYTQRTCLTMFECWDHLRRIYVMSQSSFQQVLLRSPLAHMSVHAVQPVLTCPRLGWFLSALPSMPTVRPGIDLHPTPWWTTESAMTNRSASRAPVLLHLSYPSKLRCPDTTTCATQFTALPQGFEPPSTCFRPEPALQAKTLQRKLLPSNSTPRQRLHTELLHRRRTQLCPPPTAPLSLSHTNS